MNRDKETAQERLWEHFGNLTVQKRALRTGMWLFIASEVLLFTGLFALYAGYRSVYGASFVEAIKHNNALLGTINTAVLLVSSFTMAAAIGLLAAGSRKLSLAALGATAALGVGFLVIKAFEYNHHFEQGIKPGVYYNSAELPEYGSQIAYTLYFLMTGLHALHMVGGLAVVAWMASRVWREKTTPEYHADLEVSGLYWHLVDSIWIFLWPLFYLLQ